MWNGTKCDACCLFMYGIYRSVRIYVYDEKKWVNSKTGRQITNKLPSGWTTGVLDNLILRHWGLNCCCHGWFSCDHQITADRLLHDRVTTFTGLFNECKTNLLRLCRLSELWCLFYCVLIALLLSTRFEYWSMAFSLLIYGVFYIVYLNIVIVYTVYLHCSFSTLSILFYWQSMFVDFWITTLKGNLLKIIGNESAKKIMRWLLVNLVKKFQIISFYNNMYIKKIWHF